MNGHLIFFFCFLTDRNPGRPGGNWYTSVPKKNSTKILPNIPKINWSIIYCIPEISSKNTPVSTEIYCIPDFKSPCLPYTQNTGQHWPTTPVSFIWVLKGNIIQIKTNRDRNTNIKETCLKFWDYWALKTRHVIWWQLHVSVLQRSVISVT